MYRQDVELRTIDRINFTLAHGALGDMITSLPAVIWARQNHHDDMKMVLWVHDAQVDLVKRLIAPYGNFEAVMPMTALDKAIKTQDQRWHGPFTVNGLKVPNITRNRFDMVDFAYATLLDRQPRGDHERNYPNAAPLGPRPALAPEAYVVVPVGGTSENKMFRASVMAPVLEWLLAADYMPVIAGRSTTETKAMGDDGTFHALEVKQEFDAVPEVLRARCLDLRDKTTLLELRDWCGYANAVIGVDGGTLHLAGTTNVPIVYACTQLDPIDRPIVRHNERNWNVRHIVPRELECAGCQSHWTLVFKHDFRFCMYQDNLCSYQLHAEDFINALRELGL